MGKKPKSSPWPTRPCTTRPCTPAFPPPALPLGHPALTTPASLFHTPFSVGPLTLLCLCRECPSPQCSRGSPAFSFRSLFKGRIPRDTFSDHPVENGVPLPCFIFLYGAPLHLPFQITFHICLSSPPLPISPSPTAMRCQLQAGRYACLPCPGLCPRTELATW